MSRDKWQAAYETKPTRVENDARCFEVVISDDGTIDKVRICEPREWAQTLSDKDLDDLHNALIGELLASAIERQT